MQSFDISYDAEDDFLEVTFGIFDENLCRTIPLNDNIFLFTDIGLQTVWGISFYSYSRLLGVSETEFTALRDLPDKQAELILGLMARAPASRFFNITDSEALIARIEDPSVVALISDNT